MKFFLSIIFIFSTHLVLNAQGGFKFINNKFKVTLPFELVNNLIIIPLKVNGVTLNFLLDTGVSETLIFSLEDANEVTFSDSQAIKMKGFGTTEEFTAYKCKNNILSTRNYVDANQTIYLVLDQEINISSQVGITVNGIIGYHFFKNNLIKINYLTKKITISKSTERQVTKIEKEYSKIPIELDANKPYIISSVTIDNDGPISSKLLIDTGSSDALWLFPESNSKIIVPSKAINDYLGRGLNGDVFGKRARIKSFKIANFQIFNPITSFPDSVNISRIDLSQNRVGSLGAEVIKRFDVIFNYEKSILYLKKNNLFSTPFEYNKSGIEVQHQGLQWTRDSYENNPTFNAVVLDKNGDRIKNSLHFKFELKPIFIITQIRDDSPAKKVGLLKDDVLISINGQTAGNYKLQEIIELLKGDESKTINLQIERKGKLLTFSFQLKSIL